MVEALAATNASDDAGLFVPTIAGDDQSDVLADGFFGEVAENAFGALVPTGDDAVEGLADNGIVGGVDDGGEQGGVAFGASAISDLARDFGGADNASVGVLDGRDGEGNVDESAIFALADGIEMVDAFAAPDAGHDAVLFGEPVFRDDESDVAADRFLRRIAEDALGSGVPTGDDAIEVFADNHVVGRVHDGGEQAAGLIAGVALEDVRAYVGAFAVASFEGTLDDRNQIAGEIGLTAVGARADFCRLVGDDFGIVLAYEDDRNAGTLAAKNAGRVEAVHAGHADIHEDQVGFRGAGEFDRLLAVVSFTAYFPARMTGEHGRDHPADAGIVID